MTNENNLTFTASLSKGLEGKGNKKARVLSALLSSVALGVFLEGCAKESEGIDSSMSFSSAATASAGALGDPASFSLVVSPEETPLEETPLPAIVDVEHWRGDTISLVLTGTPLPEVTTDAGDEGDNKLPLVLTDAPLLEVTIDAGDEGDNKLPLVLTDAPLLEVTIDAGDEGDNNLPLVLTDAPVPEVTTDAGDEGDDPFKGEDRVSCWLVVDPEDPDNDQLGWLVSGPGGAGNYQLGSIYVADGVFGVFDVFYGHGGLNLDELYGYGGLNNARIEGRVVVDFYDDTLEGTMILRFDGYRYEAADFASDSDNFVRDGNNLVITIDKYSDDDITDKITIHDAYNDDPNIGTENVAFTINIEFGNEGSFTPVTEAFWHSLA